MASCQCVLRFFQSICVKCRACHAKVMPGHTKCCTCHTKSSSPNWRSDAPKCKPSQEISALTSKHLWLCLLYCASHATCIFPDPLHMSHTCHRFWNWHKTPCFAHYWQGAQSPAPATQNNIWTSKSAPCPCYFFALLTSKCASHHNGVHFFNSLNFQKCSERVVFCTFWLGNVLRATTACTFLTSQHPKVLHFFDMSTSKSGLTLVCFTHLDFEMCFAPQRVLLFIPYLATWPRTRRFSEPTFRASGARNQWKNWKTKCFATFLPFRAPASSFFWLFLFSDSSHLCFSICPYCQKFDFKTSFDQIPLRRVISASIHPFTSCHLISYYFISRRFISHHFTPLHFIQFSLAFLFISFHFNSSQFIPFHSIPFVSFHLMSVRFISLFIPHLSSHISHFISFTSFHLISLHSFHLILFHLFSFHHISPFHSVHSFILFHLMSCNFFSFDFIFSIQ